MSDFRHSRTLGVPQALKQFGLFPKEFWTMDLVRWATVAVVMLPMSWAYEESMEAADRKAIAARLEQLQNVEVDFTQKAAYTPSFHTVATTPPAAPPRSTTQPAITIIVQDRTIETTNAFRFLRGNVYYGYALRDATLQQVRAGKLFEVEHHVHVCSQTRWEQMDRQANAKRAYGVITSPEKGRYEDGSIIEVALGLRPGCLRSTAKEIWLTPEWLGKMSYKELDDHRVALEDVDKDRGTKAVWTFDRKLGYALVRFEIVNLESGKAWEQITNESFRVVDHINLPYKITEVVGSEHVSQKSVLEIQQYRVGSAKNTEDSYHIAWPKGMVITDARIGKVLEAKEEGQVLDDEAIRRMTRGATSAPASDTQKGP